MQIIDLIGHRFERLTVVSRAPRGTAKNTSARWNCRCDCGRETIVVGQDLRRGRVKSCGCLNAERIVKHGQSRTMVYRLWRRMLHRCTNPKNPHYKSYGGRGISVDPRWRDFLVFLSDMGKRPSGLTLERIDNNGNYCKENCRWATRKEQANNRRDNLVLEMSGRQQTLAQWADEFGVNPARLAYRIRHGWPLRKALKTPFETNHQQKGT